MYRMRPLPSSTHREKAPHPPIPQKYPKIQPNIPNYFLQKNIFKINQKKFGQSLLPNVPLRPLSEETSKEGGRGTKEFG